MNGIELCTRFSYITNKLGYCGPLNSYNIFLNYLKNKKNEDQVKKQLLKFEGLGPYLSSIAEKSGKEIFDYNVVEAYWIGNELLDNFNDEDMKNIIKKLIQHGLPKSFGEKLTQKMPSGFFPHHHFNVFYVGVGMLTKAVGVSLQNMDNCRISWGKVIEVLENKLIADTKPLKKEKNEYVLGQEETKTAVFNPIMLPDVKKNDFVAMHWGFACLVMKEDQLKNLKEYTNKTLKVINSSIA